MKKDLERKLLVIDEAWALLSRTEDASYIFEIVKTCRKFNLGLFLINQEVEGMLESQAGRSVLANISYTLLLKQKPAVIEAIQKTFFLSNTERTSLLTAGVGEGLLIMENEHSEIKIVSSEAEHKQITTNADEILANKENDLSKMEQVKSEQPKAKIFKPKVVNISVDPEKGFYRNKGLNLDEVKYLIHKKYKEYYFYSILDGKKEKYLLRPRFNESPQHCFLTFEIADYLKKFTDKVYLYQTKRPDIIFEIGKNKFAIEIETGKILKSNKKQILDKVDILKKEFGNNWIFVVTDRNLVSEYSKYGETYEKRNILPRLLQAFKKKPTDNPLSVKDLDKKPADSSEKSAKKPTLSAGIIRISARSQKFARSSKHLQNVKGGDKKNGKRKR